MARVAVLIGRSVTARPTDRNIGRRAGRHRVRTRRYPRSRARR